jgi:hypothetical protein
MKLRFMKKAGSNIKENVKQSPGSSMGPVYSFFCWCSGARLHLLRQCHTDYNIFLGIGLVTFLTGVLAALSGSYAFYTVFNLPVAAAVFGLFWGSLIFALDWYLVASFKKQGSLKNELFMSAPRLVFAFFLAVVIAKPIELKLFESEILAEIHAQNIKKTINQQKTIDQGFGEIEKLMADNENMAQQLQFKEVQRNALYASVIDEAEGRSKTGQSGKGPVYRDKRDALDRAEKELGELKNQVIPIIQANTERVHLLREMRDQRIDESAGSLGQATGFLARLEAMQRLSAKSESAAAASIFIMLLFLCLESAPIFVKLLSSKGAYDYLLETEIELSRLGFEAGAKLKELQLQEQIEELERRSISLKTEHEALDQLYKKAWAEAKKELDKKNIQKWKAGMLEQIGNVADNYAPEEIAAANKS